MLKKQSFLFVLLVQYHCIFVSNVTCFWDFYIPISYRCSECYKKCAYRAGYSLTRKFSCRLYYFWKSAREALFQQSADQRPVFLVSVWQVHGPLSCTMANRTGKFAYRSGKTVLLLHVLHSTENKCLPDSLRLQLLLHIRPCSAEIAPPPCWGKSIWRGCVRARVPEKVNWQSEQQRRRLFVVNFYVASSEQIRAALHTWQWACNFAEDFLKGTSYNSTYFVLQRRKKRWNRSKVWRETPKIWETPLGYIQSLPCLLFQLSQNPLSYLCFPPDKRRRNSVWKLSVNRHTQGKQERILKMESSPRNLHIYILNSEAAFGPATKEIKLIWANFVPPQLLFFKKNLYALHSPFDKWDTIELREQIPQKLIEIRGIAIGNNLSVVTRSILLTYEFFSWRTLMAYFFPSDAR